MKEVERNSDREEVRIEQSCLRVLALFEPVASDLRRMATILKVSRDWERIADLSARIARRTRKLACGGDGVGHDSGLTEGAGERRARSGPGQLRSARGARFRGCAGVDRRRSLD